MLTARVLVLSLLGVSSLASHVSFSYQDVSLRSVECPVTKPSDPGCFGPFDDKLKALINDIIANMDKPNDVLGLPPLDPLVLQGLQLNLVNDFIDVQGNLSLEAVGLKQLEVPFAKFCLIGAQLFLNLSLPSLNVKGSYAIDGWLGGDLLYVFGDGPLTLDVGGISLYVNVGLKTNSVTGFLYVGNLELGLDIQNITVNIENLYHDAEVSEVLSGVLNEAVPTLLDLYKQEVTCFATDAVAGLLDQKLGTLTMKDLVCLIQQNC